MSERLAKAEKSEFPKEVVPSITFKVLLVTFKVLLGTFCLFIVILSPSNHIIYYSSDILSSSFSTSSRIAKYKVVQNGFGITKKKSQICQDSFWINGGKAGIVRSCPPTNLDKTKLMLDYPAATHPNKTID